MAKSLNEQAQEILKIAEESGVQSNFFFITTFKRYQVQMNMLAELEQAMKKDGMLVTKEYVKGRKNVYSSPAVKGYNATTDSANKTVATLLRIIKAFNVSDTEQDDDPLMKALQGDSDEGDQ